METRYSVRQTADMTGVKPYVLRYWEEELEMVIHRNEMGHRYYTEEDIQLILNIKELKRKGLQLRAVKELLPELIEEICEKPKNTHDQIKSVRDEKNSSENLKELKAVLAEELNEKENAKNNGTKILEFQAILERLILRELGSRDEEEEKCRSLDMAIRRQQLARKEVAAACERKNARREKNM